MVLLVTIRQTSGEATVTLNATGAIVAVGSAAPLVVSAPVEGEADKVAAELRMLSQDAALFNALSVLVRRAATQ